MTRTILVVDDEKRLCDLVRAYLTQEGFRVLTASNGQEALYVARHERPDLILLDLMMPEMGGYEFMRAYVREGDAPIIILTAKLEEQDKVLGLELGADDYVTKPFSMRELTARVRAVLRRMEKSRPAAKVLRSADITLDRVGRVVTVGEQHVDLTPSEFDLLATLMSAPGRAFSRFDLLESIQGDAYAGYQRTIDVHVRNLRTKIEADPSHPRYIESVYGVGYRFAANLAGCREPDMRSLTLKLTLAFLVVGVVGVVLVALFVRQRTRSEFDQFVLTRFQQDLYDDLTEYYQANGGWEGIDTIAFVGRTGPLGHRGVFPAPVTLLDADNAVVYGGRRYQKGQILNPADGTGVPIDVDSITVGRLIFEPFRESTPPNPESPESAFLGRFNQAIIMGALGAIAVALLIGVLLARTISRPARELTAATQMIAQGELGYQVPVRTRDELGELTTSFNQMSADLAHSTEQRRQMTADIAHELRTPLSLIMGYTEALSDGKLEGTPQTFDILHEEAQHLNRLVDDLRTLSLADAGELSLNRRPVRPQALLQRVASAYATQVKENDVTLQVKADGDVSDVDVDPDRMVQVLGNLVNNAMRHTPAGGEICLSAEPRAGAVVLVVRDTGTGIAPEHLPHVFDRFYRGDESRFQSNGESGLGLAIAKSIVEAHDGKISVVSAPGAGTTVTVQLPSNDA